MRAVTEPVRGLHCEQMPVGAWCGSLNETDLLPSFESRGQVSALTSGSCLNTFQLIIVDSERLLKGCLIPAG